MTTLQEFLSAQREWSERTFGPGKRTIGVTEHIKKEIEEVRENPEDLTEWVDIILLALDGYWRHGGQPETIMADMIAKQEKNFKRTYNRTAEDQPSFHVKSHAEEMRQRRAANQCVRCGSTLLVNGSCMPCIYGEC